MKLLRAIWHKAREFGIPLIYYVYNYGLTYFPVHAVRLFYLRHVLGVRIGHHCFIHMGCFFEGKKIEIGNHTVIGRNCILSGGNLIIKNNVSITAHTYIFCTSHYKDSPEFRAFSQDVVIEDYAWVGARAMILPGVRIGKGAILGAASTASKNIPDYAVFAGAPAKEVATRARDLIYNLDYNPYFN